MTNVIILSDGTGNGAAKRHGTNVRRLYEALDLRRDDQIAFYDDGVGSEEFLPLKLAGGVFGWGLKRNVLEMYRFLCRVYRQQGTAEKHIYLFGFSRGAFTVRVLAGMILHCGICTQFKNEKDLDRIAQWNYRRFREEYKRGYLYQLLRWLANPLVARHDFEFKARTHCAAKIAFIGVWDTVDAYGLPIDELADIWDRFIYPIRFPDQQLSKDVIRACHALAVDDERLTFHPLLWNEKHQTNDENPRIEQVWFPGVHCDVGGGYPESELAMISLDWMIRKVETPFLGEPPLHFIPRVREEIEARIDCHGKQHDSRSGLAAYYRYKPRNIEALCHDDEHDVYVENPKIHASVFERISGGFSGYAPTGIPSDYALALSGDMVPASPESPNERVARHWAMNPALDLIFWRRWLYGFLVVATLLLLFSPWALQPEESGVCDGTACVLDPVFSVGLAVLPDIAGRWLETLRQNAWFLWGSFGLFGILFALKIRLLSRTRCHAEAAWSRLTHGTKPPSWAPTGTYRFRRRAHSRLRTRMKRALAGILFIVFVALALVVVNRFVQHVLETLF